MGFTAASVSELAYDFTKVGGGKGVTPEPSADQVREMQFKLRRLFKLDLADDETDETGETDTTGLAALNKRMAAITEDEIRERDGELIEIYAEVCSQQPSAEELRALPHRTLQMYIGWLSGELNSPTAGSSVTKRSLAPVKNA